MEDRLHFFGDELADETDVAEVLEAVAADDTSPVEFELALAA